jgi:uncharacterized OB-fold protein
VSSSPERPLPLPDDDSAPYWEAAARGELRMQRCTGCRAWRFPPRRRCSRCGSDAAAWERVSGRGTIYSFVVAHAPVLPSFAQRVPFAVVLVELDEDPQLRLVGNLLDATPDEVRVGMHVELVFETVADGVALPQWQRAGRDR